MFQIITTTHLISLPPLNHVNSAIVFEALPLSTFLHNSSYRSAKLLPPVGWFACYFEPGSYHKTAPTSGGWTSLTAE